MAVETQLQQLEKEFAAAKEELQQMQKTKERDRGRPRDDDETRAILLELERERGRLAGRNWARGRCGLRKVAVPRRIDLSV